MKFACCSCFIHHSRVCVQCVAGGPLLQERCQTARTCQLHDASNACTDGSRGDPEADAGSHDHGEAVTLIGHTCCCNPLRGNADNCLQMLWGPARAVGSRTSYARGKTRAICYYRKALRVQLHITYSCFDAVNYQVVRQLHGDGVASNGARLAEQVADLAHLWELRT
jgi:hypothetical protein